MTWRQPTYYSSYTSPAVPSKKAKNVTIGVRHLTLPFRGRLRFSPFIICLESPESNQWNAVNASPNGRRRYIRHCVRTRTKHCSLEHVGGVGVAGVAGLNPEHRRICDFDDFGVFTSENLYSVDSFLSKSLETLWNRIFGQ